LRVDGFSSFSVDLFLVFIFTGPARRRTPVTGALSLDSSLYYVRKVRGQNFPSRVVFPQKRSFCAKSPSRVARPSPTAFANRLRQKRYGGQEGAMAVKIVGG
jgi:hypothetical protein